jgi:hypothetical protein
MKINSVLIAAALFIATMGSASATLVAVGGQTGPWDPTISGNPDYGTHDNGGPATVLVTSGATITIAYVSGLTSAFDGAPPSVDGMGYVGAIFGSGVGRTGIGSSGTPLPSFFIDPTNTGPDINLNELIGAFADATGLLVGSPFAVGNGLSMVAPAGATALLLGLNDDIFSDNSGELQIDVVGRVQSVPEPSALALMLFGLAGLGSSWRRPKIGAAAA